MAHFRRKLLEISLASSQFQEQLETKWNGNIFSCILSCFQFALLHPQESRRPDPQLHLHPHHHLHVSGLFLAKKAQILPSFCSFLVILVSFLVFYKSDLYYLTKNEPIFESFPWNGNEPIDSGNENRSEQSCFHYLCLLDFNRVCWFAVWDLALVHPCNVERNVPRVGKLRQRRWRHQGSDRNVQNPRPDAPTVQKQATQSYQENKVQILKRRCADNP